MARFARNFLTFWRDYGIQDGAGLPEIVPAIFPVTVIDDCSKYQLRTYPIRGGSDTQAAVAAVFSLVGVGAFGPGPIRILQAQDFGQPVGVSRWIINAAEIRSANQGTTALGVALERGQIAGNVSGLMLTGTVAALPAGLVDYDSTLAGAAPFPSRLDFKGLVLRPGEFLWLACGTANTALSATFAWEEMTFPLNPNPPALT